MQSEPLHVQVAKALGWTDVQSLGVRNYGAPSYHKPDTEVWVGRKPGALGFSPIPYFDQDWEATGPIIERLRIRVRPRMLSWWADAEWSTGVDAAETPLKAVCLLLLEWGQQERLRNANSTIGQPSESH